MRNHRFITTYTFGMFISKWFPSEELIFLLQPFFFNQHSPNYFRNIKAEIRFVTLLRRSLEDVPRIASARKLKIETICD